MPFRERSKKQLTKNEQVNLKVVDNELFIY